MNIKEFIGNFQNHPVMFVGAGISLRYLENSYNWNGLLKKICEAIDEDERYYLDLKAKHIKNEKCNYAKLAKEIEEQFNVSEKIKKDNRFTELYDVYYEKMKKGTKTSVFKLYIAELLSDYKINTEKKDELLELDKAKKNIGSIITTNYDEFIEKELDFEPLVGNDILLSNPYGSVYKIHGSVTDPSKIIITKDDYEVFESKYELIRAQLVSLFVHNPIIFIGYSLGDENVKKILGTIFSYVGKDTDLAEKVRKNFLVVERCKASSSLEVSDYDITLGNDDLIRINKLKTDNFIELYRCLANLKLSISTMDIRKVQSVFSDIFTNAGKNSVNVKVSENVDTLKNSETVLFIGPKNVVQYVYKTTADTIKNYFFIIKEKDENFVKIVDQLRIGNKQYFPVYGFAKIKGSTRMEKTLKPQQSAKMEFLYEKIKEKIKIEFNSIKEIMENSDIAKSNKNDCIFWNVYEENIELDDLEEYIKKMNGQFTTDYKKLLCLYDMKKYS